MTQFAFVTYEPTSGLLKSVVVSPPMNLETVVDTYCENLQVVTTGTDEEGQEHEIEIPVISPSMGGISAKIQIPNDDTDYAVVVANAAKEELSSVEVDLVDIEWSNYQLAVNDTLVIYQCNPKLNLKERGTVADNDLSTNTLRGYFLLDSDDIYDTANTRIIDNVSIDVDSDGNVDFMSFLEGKKIISTDGVLSLATIEE
jgi:hypothetical protein